MKNIKQIRWNGLDAKIFQNDRYSSIEYHAPVRSLSTAVLGGGFKEIRRVLNLKVQANPEGKDPGSQPIWEPPEITLQGFAKEMGWNGPIAGMMTSALMDSFRLAFREEKWGGIFCVLTAGLSNARAAGDPADFLPEVMGEMLPTGTINILIGTNVSFSDAALVEAVMIATEAKTTVLSQYGIKSPLSGAPATGTGTDSILISSGNGPKVAFCGKHTRIGQLLGETVIEALSSSVQYLLSR